MALARISDDVRLERADALKLIGSPARWLTKSASTKTDDRWDEKGAMNGYDSYDSMIKCCFVTSKPRNTQKSERVLEKKSICAYKGQKPM